MATTDVLPESHDRQPHRRRPFSTWVKKLTNFKSSSDSERPRRYGKKKRGVKVNNPYPESGHVGRNHDNNNNNNDTNNNESAASVTTGQTGSRVSLDNPNGLNGLPNDDLDPPPITGRSGAGTASTDNEASHSINAPSHGTSSFAGTSRTVGGGFDSRKGGDSTFSSPAPSVRSLTTTLTTIQSMAPNGSHATGNAATSGQNNTQSIQFSQPFPTTSPASAIPAHLTPNGVPNTYTTATANGLLTDNASILTLASSSKRRRRRSMDTDASVRALAPSSVWGGSRESLPLSVLSANIESSGMQNTPGLHGSTSRIGAERNSIYSSTGVPPAVSGDRNSYYAKQGDGASIRSGRPGHVRTESLGAANAAPYSPLATNEKSGKVDKEETVTEGSKDE